MIVLDTNVLSEVLKPSPSHRVLRWMEDQDPTEVFITAITQAEILYGVERLPQGPRRLNLSQAVEAIFSEEFQDRILPFDERAARSFATIVCARFSAGRPISQPDAMIAAIAKSLHACVATRNITDFELCGLDLVDPWSVK